MTKPIEPIYRLLGARIEQIRTTMGLSQDELAQKLNLSRGSIANIEAGKQRILLHDLVNIAGAFHMSPKNFIKGIWL